MLVCDNKEKIPQTVNELIIQMFTEIESLLREKWWSDQVTYISYLFDLLYFNSNCSFEFWTNLVCEMCPNRHYGWIPWNFNWHCSLGHLILIQ